MIGTRYVISQETAKQIWETEEVYAQVNEDYEFLIESEADLMEAIECNMPLSVEQRR